MIFNIELIEACYERLSLITDGVRKIIGKPLSYSEKILYSHLSDLSTLRNYKRGTDYAIFEPDRVAMQDATAQMALLQFMLSGKESSEVQASVHCDHLINARDGASDDLAAALSANQEVYDFLSSACNKYGIDFWKPGAGIIHQIVLENYAFPGGMMTGTDSHTVNAGGLGMVAVGVGGADAVDVMTGLGWELKFPLILGVKLTGKLNGWVSAKDIILKLSGILSVKGGTGYIIEYFGEGAQSLSCTGKATVCNMGAEVGATGSLFGFDDSMARYLSATGRHEVAELALKNRDNLTADPEVYAEPEKFFDRFIEINLSELEPYINGPFTPDLATPVSKMRNAAAVNNWPVKIEAGLIGSCTNSSYEDISRAASVAADALTRKLIARSQFTVTPGSEQIRKVAERDGYLEIFRKMGGKIFANACGPCIGQWDRKKTDNKKVNTIIHSFNRNFAGRSDGNPNTHAFVASPEIVTALTIAGDITFNPLTDYLINRDGDLVKLSEPSGYELPPEGFADTEAGLQKPADDPESVTININPESERLQLLTPFPAWDGNDFIGLPLLIKAKGKCTTDHISMAGYWLKYRGHLKNISENYMIGAVNFFNDKTNSVLNIYTGKYEPVPAVAKHYKASGAGSVVVGEENFGEGSSREHAAMEPRFLGIKAIIAKSFARIHETNLKKQGVLALIFSEKSDYDKIRETDVIDITGLRDLTPEVPLKIILNHSDGLKETIYALHTYNRQQIEWFKAGSALNLIRTNKSYGRKNKV